MAVASSVKKLVTHHGPFHSDDVFACAALILKLEREGEKYEVIRTRDQVVIESGHYVFDVGGVYDEEKNRFDHHQAGGAGKRGNALEYASFGLVWRKFGAELCGLPEAAELVDKKLVQPIDAGDNGVNLVELTSEVRPYFIQHAFKAFRPSWKHISEQSLLSAFLECVKLAKGILSKEIDLAKDTLEGMEKVFQAYQKAESKKIIVLDERYPWEEEIIKYPEPLFVVFPRLEELFWGVEGVAAEPFSFKKRKSFPSSWAGLRDVELQKASGVEDAVFCHRGLFMAVAKSKEGAMKLAQIAIDSL